MTNDDFASEIIQKQENTRTDIRALRDEISQLRTALAANTELLQQVASFQATQDRREERQTKIAEDIAQIAHSIAGLVENENVKSQELMKHLRETRLSTSVDATLNQLIAKMMGLGLVLNKHTDEQD